MILNLTHNGVSADFQVDGDMDNFSDDDLKRIAVEIAKPGWVGLADHDLRNSVVDRMPWSPGVEPRAYIRPKVPFGGEF